MNDDMKSKIVEGKIWHARVYPVKHAFEYPVYFFQFDVDELKDLSQVCGLFSLNRWNILSLNEKDYLRPTADSLRVKVEQLLSEQGIKKPATLELITQTRYFGWAFNPVSFFFCRDSEKNLIAVIADVNNTFGEGHAYILKDFSEVETAIITYRLKFSGFSFTIPNDYDLLRKRIQEGENPAFVFEKAE